MTDHSIFGLSPFKRNTIPPGCTIVPLGGFGQIGMNCMVWATETSKVIVDCGLMFPGDQHLGIDIIIPQFDYILENKDNIKGIVLTHGHEDHIGALPWLVPHLSVPIYSSEFTLGLVRRKLEERGLAERCPLIPVTGETPVRLGDFTFHFFPVCHSIIDGFALGVETPAGKIVHTGDFKIDEDPLEGPGTDLDAFSEFAGEEGALLLLSDSTNVESEGTSLSERLVLANLQKIFKEATGRIVVTLFSSHIQRIQEVFDCAQETGRIVAVSGRSLVNNIETARALGKLRTPENLYLSTRDLPSVMDKNVVLLVTGSQGEPMSALSRIASGGHKDLAIHEGDVVILSSRMIPGNTVAVTTLINTLYRCGADVYYDKAYPVHASGHAQREELRAVFNAVRPKFFVPVHGEYRHLVKHVRLAEECGVPKNNCAIIENGMPFTVTAGSLDREPHIEAGAVFVDGKGVGDVGQAVLKERHILGGEGLVIVLMVMDESTGTILHGPEIFSKGFVFEQQFDHVLEDSKCLVLDAVEARQGGEPISRLQEAIRTSLRRFFRRVLDRDPIVIPGVISV